MQSCLNSHSILVQQIIIAQIISASIVAHTQCRPEADEAVRDPLASLIYPNTEMRHNNHL